MAKYSAELIDSDLLKQFTESSKEAMKILRLDKKADSRSIVEAIDQFVYKWQRGTRPKIPCEVDDLPYYLGSLWGDQIVREFGWAWHAVTFHEYDDSIAPGVVSPDNSMVIYPIHFIIGCLQDETVDATILLSYNMLDEDTIALGANESYVNVMDHVFRIVPR